MVTVLAIIVPACSVHLEVSSDQAWSGDTGNGTADSVFGLRPGDCFNDISDDEADHLVTIPTVDCNKPHANEATGILTLSYAGLDNDLDRIAAIANDGCINQLEKYVGADYLDTPYVSLELFQNGTKGSYGLVDPDMLGGADPHAVLCFLFSEESAGQGMLYGPAG